jgi:AraC-like DNA-binding protein
MDFVYQFFRGASGFTIAYAGFIFLFIRGREKVQRSFGVLFLMVGFLFDLSALDPVLHLPDDISNPVIIVAIFFLSQAFFNLALYMFGGERHRGYGRRVTRIGLLWSVILAALPFLDYLFRLGPVTVDPEDAHPLAPFHAFTNITMYAWPIIMTILVFFIARYTLKDLRPGTPQGRSMRWAAVGIGIIIGVVAVGLALPSVALYRIGNCMLETLMLVWYFFTVRNPEVFKLLRSEIAENHERNLVIKPDEAALIAQRLEKIVKNKDLIFSPELDIKRLAKAVNVPPYRLSNYFNAHCNMTFSTWINELKIDYVKRLLVEEPDRTIFEIMMDSGYVSKAVFNGQFSKIVGMSPSEYRKRTKEPQPQS